MGKLTETDKTATRKIAEKENKMPGLKKVWMGQVAWRAWRMGPAMDMKCVLESPENHLI